MKRSFLVLSLLTSIHLAAIHHVTDAMMLARTAAKSVWEVRKKRNRTAQDKNSHKEEFLHTPDHDGSDL